MLVHTEKRQSNGKENEEKQERRKEGPQRVEEEETFRFS